MAATIKDETIAHSMMFLFLGASALLVFVQWRAWAVGSGQAPDDPPIQQAVVASQPRSQVNSLQANSFQANSTSATTPSTAVNASAKLAKAPAKSVSAQAKANSSQVTTGNPKEKTGSVIEGLHLVVNLSDRRVYVYEGKDLKVSYPLAVGQEGWETPTGSFEVIEMQKRPKWLHPITREVVPPGPDNPLGERWIGFWADERTHIGFHGTNQEDLIGQAVSHGCLRMRNRDVIALYEKVSEGTPVFVRN
ncbi:L,D-transpeptidase [Leptothermofonsia sichuanensis]|uniref:L,D-transpeptidase n=1 Tax=Leptothermofonsia sichuanensis TaxID=2917832 RepID=UPI001CED6576|nr:L,D-transpeptidase [Leptothermofonsia sichuanensis]